MLSDLSFADASRLTTDDDPQLLLRLFIFFFWKSISRIREKEQKLGPITFLQRGPQLGDDPVSHFRLVTTRPTLQGPVQRRRRDLNQDRSNFFGRGKRRESKWDLDSRNVPYGIFSATPKKRAK